MKTTMNLETTNPIPVAAIALKDLNPATVFLIPFTPFLKPETKPPVIHLLEQLTLKALKIDY